MKHIFNVALLMVAIGLQLGYVAVQADDAEVLSKIDERLETLKTYNYTSDGGPLRDLEHTIFKLPTDSTLRSAIEQKLIDALGEANDTGRGIICRQLRVIGTDRCVAAVSPMLTEEKLSHFARYTLEGLGSDAALKAMHEAVDKTSGMLLVGILNSLSNAGYQPMRDDCNKLLGSDDPEAVAAAVRALGRLGGKESVAALTSAKSDASEQNAMDIDLALLGCAEKLLDSGDAQAAGEIYETLYSSAGKFRLAGLRGLVIAKPDSAVDLLVSAIEQGDPQLAACAINLTPEVKDDDATARFVGLLDKVPAQSKVLMLGALGSRGDAAAVRAVAEATVSEDSQVRLAAVDALGSLSGSEAIDTLLKVANQGDDTCRRVARASLARIVGAVPRLKETALNSDDGFAVEAIRALAARKASDTTDLMLQLAKDEKTLRRAAAIDAIGQLASADKIGLVVQLVVAPKTVEDLPAIEKSLGFVLMRIKDPSVRAAAILAALPGASAEVRPVMIRQLSRSGTADALVAVREALQSSDTATLDAAVASLSSWPNSTAGGDLIRLIESPRTPELKATALAGYLRIATDSDNTSAMFLDLLKNVSSVNDKKLVLNEIGLNCESFEAVDMTQSLLVDPQLKATSAIATIRIAYKLRIHHKDETRKILENVLAKVDHPDVQKRAQEVLNDLDKYEDHIMQWVAIGPFVDQKILSGEQNYKTVFEPEKADTSDLEWKPLTLGIGSWDINLESTYGAIDHCSAFVRTMIWSPVDQDIQVEGGCDDALRMWVNGELVFDDYSIRGGSPRTMRAPAKLREGWNELKLKSVDHEGGWQFGCRVRRPNGTKIEGLKYEAR